MEEQNFINEILNSTNGMMKIAPNNALFDEIQNKLNQQNYVSSKVLWKIAASIFILVSINVFLIRKNFKTDKKISSSFENIYNKNNQLY
ncbi:MAG: hypothetical protein H7174_13595 [Flavobacterium sp.]|nr:hypothetical protein [Flavobacterium sp.]